MKRDVLRPLSGVRVVALEQAVAAPLCTRHLADLGADVIKVERPGVGDFARQLDSVVNGQSAYFVWLNRGKRSVELDMKTAAGVETISALVATADVFIHNLGPGSAERLGLSWDGLNARLPRLIMCAISGYGRNGPYGDRKSFDLLLQGEAAVLAVTGTADLPAKVGFSIADICAGMYALAAVLAALNERHRTGKGRLVEISMLECLAEWMMPSLYHQVYSGLPPSRDGMRHNMIVPYGPYRAGDGVLVNLAVQNQSQWARLCRRVLDRPELVDDPRFASNELRVRNRLELEPLIEAIFTQRDARAIEAALTAADVPFGHVNTVAELAEHPQLTARHRWLEAQSGAGPIKFLADPLNFSGLPPSAGSIPRLGEHTSEVLAELGLGRQAVRETADPPGGLAGLADDTIF
jgi:crotonobetainyl-CoA:carnitine CoA-transferase CaiB-like acyl-CoA transferase